MSDCDCSDCECDCGSCNDCCGDDQDCCECCNDDPGNDQTNVEGQRENDQGCWFCVTMTGEDCCDDDRRRRRRRRYEQRRQNEAQNSQPNIQTTPGATNDLPVISSPPPSYDEATSDAVTSQPV